VIFQFIGTILAAAWVTLCVAFAGLALAIMLGLVAAFAKLSGRRLLRWLASLYTFVVRSIPDFMIMLLIYYSLPALLNRQMGLWGLNIRIEFPPMIAGIAALGLIFGAYMAETFRNALMNIPKGQIEAAIAYGLPPGRIFIRIILAQFIRLALPGFTNNWLVLVKASALVSLIGLQDVMFRAKGAAEATSMPFTFYMVAGAFYLALTLASLIFLGLLARRFEIGIREIMP